MKGRVRFPTRRWGLPPPENPQKGELGEISSPWNGRKGTRENPPGWGTGPKKKGQKRPKYQAERKARELKGPATVNGTQTPRATNLFQRGLKGARSKN